MAFPGEQPGGGVQADPAGAGDENLRPGVQVGEIHLGTGGTVQRFHIGLELDQIAGDKARRQAQMAQDLYQQPGGIPAGTTAFVQSLLAGLYPRFHANDICDVLVQVPVEFHQKIDNPSPACGPPSPATACSSGPCSLISR